jgi:multidrug transporter EmrE-like cation transporter
MKNYNCLFLFFIILATLFEVGADILFKQWAINNKSVLIIIGMALYTVGTVIWAFSLKYNYLSKAITIFTALNLILVVLVGVLFFKEDLTLLQKIGVLLAVISVVLIEL